MIVNMGDAYCESLKALSSKFVSEFDQFESSVLEQMENIRDEYQISYALFAELSGTDASGFSRVRSGERKLNLKTFIIFCQVFGYDLSILTAKKRKDDVAIAESVQLLDLLQSLPLETLNKIKISVSRIVADEKNGAEIVDMIDKLALNKANYNIAFSKHASPEYIKSLTNKNENKDE